MKQKVGIKPNTSQQRIIKAKQITFKNSKQKQRGRNKNIAENSIASNNVVLYLKYALDE